MMAITNMEIDSLLSPIEFKILVTGIGDVVLEEENIVIPEFISTKGWDIIRHLSFNVSVFKGIDKSILN